MAAQFLKGLRSGLIIVWELLPGGNRVGAGAVRQAALRGALVPTSLLLPVQVVLYQELQLWEVNEKQGREKMKRKGLEEMLVKRKERGDERGNEWIGTNFEK